MRIDENIRDTSELYMREFNFILKNIDSDATGFWARSLVKSAISFFEAVTFQLKNKIIEMKDIDLTSAEIYFLNGKQFDLKSNGSVKERNIQVHLQDDIKFTLNLLIKVTAYELANQFSDNGWSDLLDTIKVRNRLTHPKLLVDQVVTENEIKVCCHAFLWLLGNTNYFVEQENIKLKQYIMESTKEIEEYEMLLRNAEHLTSN